ncbi:plasmid pRiA4b ORF-3 family protein [Streptomyces sp. NPDC060031]|uniref:plasmid pRiA4b ORF-3 family protein n=1 Tax=Streptomyces sp. NPDC060031 TaxID=3347043 RepID=UPI0036C8AD06
MTDGQADLQLKIVLTGSRPPLWRRIVLPSDAPLGTLHDAIQIAFGWGGGHPHLFADEFGRHYGDHGARHLDIGGVDQDATALGDVLVEAGAGLTYTYDLGDDWGHRITLEKTLPRPQGAPRAVRCTGGRRAHVPAEDIGGVRGLAEVLELLDHPDGAGHDPYGELIADLRAQGYDPAVFDKGEVTARLARLAVGTVSAGAPAPREGVERLTARDVELCTCGRCRVGDPVVSAGVDFEDFEGFEDPDELAAPLRPVTLAPREDLVAAVRSVPVFDAALRLAAWCAEGRQVTAREVLRPAAAREAIEELQLWKLADAGSAYADAASRALTSLRSAGDVPCLDDPWRLALDTGLITISGGRTRAGTRVDDSGEELLECWSEVLGAVLEEIGDSALDLLPGALGAAIGGSLAGSGLAELWGETADGIVGALYETPDDAWLDLDDMLAELGGLEAGDLVAPQESDLVEVLLAACFRELGEGAGPLGAVEYEPGERGGDTPGDLLRAVLNAVGGMPVDGTGALEAATAKTAAEEGCAGRMRLTPLGRYGVREHLRDYGVRVPLLGEYAEADAATLLLGVLGYTPEAMRQEVDGWLERRSAVDAAVQLLDACAGTGPEASARRGVAQLVLAGLDDLRALRVLRKAADSEVEGVRQVAAATAGAHPPADPPADRAQAAEAASWLFIDSLSLLVDGLDGMELYEAFRGDHQLPAGELEQLADELWRVAHPATGQVLATLGDKLRDTDKRLAKQLRTAANKARSRQ